MGIDLRPLIYFGIIIGALLIACITVPFIIKYKHASNQIISEKPIIPEKRLIIKNNKVDTLYIYRKK